MQPETCDEIVRGLTHTHDHASPLFVLFELAAARLCRSPGAPLYARCARTRWVNFAEPVDDQLTLFWRAALGQLARGASCWGLSNVMMMAGVAVAHPGGSPGSNGTSVRQPTQTVQKVVTRGHVYV